MAIDLAQFHDAFFDESFEALDTMEAALLRLNVGAPDSELINTIFRVAHSIKGGSATFGFAEVASFTHTCEALLDELRSHRMNVTRALTDLLLKAVDVMREMLRAVQSKTPVDAQRVTDLQFDLELAIAQGNMASAGPAPGLAAAPTCETATPAPEVTAGEVTTRLAAEAAGHHWHISFRPYPQLLTRGNDPLRMLRELSELGPLTVTADIGNLPALELMDPESCYLAWDLQLQTESSREAIEQIFDWAEGDCELEIQSRPVEPVVKIESTQDLPMTADAARPVTIAQRQGRTA